MQYKGCQKGPVFLVVFFSQLRMAISRRCAMSIGDSYVTGSNFQSWSTSKCHTAGTTLQIIDMTKLHPSCIIKVTWFSVDIISPLLDAFFLHIIVVLTATGYPLHLLKYLLLEKDPVTPIDAVDQAMCPWETRLPPLTDNPAPSAKILPVCRLHPFNQEQIVLLTKKIRGVLWLKIINFVESNNNYEKFLKTLFLALSWPQYFCV